MTPRENNDYRSGFENGPSRTSRRGKRRIVTAGP
eukprot:CAMPEP_0172583940 /NCGR_PEP_ID=MMETSP1068-20121228/3489_1 /TAXON_ID=35684 /ORGANISM="Pseudopedinella elastica, Strain CCMP716" /LENGTH=33 /DNA_ID= /DNA_START= /DNA_END= /DNA_ORIENTATION=